MKKWQIVVAIIVSLGLAVASLIYDFHSNENCVTIISGLWSALATAAIGGVAYWQNKQYKKLSDDYNDLALMPEMYISTAFNDRVNGINNSVFTKVTGALEDGIKSRPCNPIKLWFVKGPIIDLKVKEIRHGKDVFPCTDKDGQSFRDETTPVNLVLNIPATSTNDKFNYVAVLEYENIYGTKYQKNVEFSVGKDNSTPDNIVLRKAGRV